MPKRSLDPGNNDAKKIEQLNSAADAVAGGGPMASLEERPSGGKHRAAGAHRRRFARLPRESFKARLKSELEGRNNMATVAEPIAAVHPVRRQD
jgi:hypothetical protein